MKMGEYLGFDTRVTGMLGSDMYDCGRILSSQLAKHCKMLKQCFYRAILYEDVR